MFWFGFCIILNYDTRLFTFTANVYWLQILAIAPEKAISSLIKSICILGRNLVQIQIRAGPNRQHFNK